MDHEALKQHFIRQAQQEAERQAVKDAEHAAWIKKQDDQREESQRRLIASLPALARIK